MDLRDKELEKQYTEYRSQLNKEGKIVYVPLGESEAAKEIERRGIAFGIEKGIEQMARAMIVRGMEIESISQITGLSFERIKMLQSTNI